MNTPIKREDIRKGDRVRTAVEYTALSDRAGSIYADATYELIERPVQLPNVPGIYADRDGDPWDTRGGTPLRAEYGPYTLLRPVAEVAAEVLADFRAGWTEPLISFEDVLKRIAAKFGVTA